MIPSSWIQLCRLHQEIEILLSLTLGFRRAWKFGKNWVLVGCWDDAPEWVLLHFCKLYFTASFFLRKAFVQVPMGMCCISFVPRKHEHVVKLVDVAWSPSSGALSRIHWSHKVETFCPCYNYDTWWSKILENENLKQIIRDILTFLISSRLQSMIFVDMPPLDSFSGGTFQCPR